MTDEVVPVSLEVVPVSLEVVPVSLEVVPELAVGVSVGDVSVSDVEVDAEVDVAVELPDDVRTVDEAVVAS